jgi:HSP20 family protein
MLPRLNTAIFPSFINDLFDEEFWVNNENMSKGISVPSVNIKEGEKDYTIEIAAPGLQKRDFNIDVDRDTLTVSAEKSRKNEDEEKKYTRREFSYTKFSRSFTCPDWVNKDKIEAKYEDGVLSINIPKQKEQEKPKKKISIS